jgi:hypothetical protein
MKGIVNQNAQFGARGGEQKRTDGLQRQISRATEKPIYLSRVHAQALAIVSLGESALSELAHYSVEHALL